MKTLSLQGDVALLRALHGVSATVGIARTTTVVLDQQEAALADCNDPRDNWKNWRECTREDCCDPDVPEQTLEQPSANPERDNNGCMIYRRTTPSDLDHEEER